MGLYKAGTIAISTAGAATGTGTAWTTAGTGIRTGQTILVNTNPAQQFSIQAINNATSLTLSPTPTAAIAAGTTYAILTTDALSVDGLGSQVAEAITYFKTSLNDRAAAGANSDITSLGGLTTALSVAQGGTGASSAVQARANLFLGSMATQSADAVNITKGVITGITTFQVTNTGEAIQLKPATDGPSYIRGQKSDSTLHFYIGRGTASTNDVQFNNYIGGNGLNLVSSGAIVLSTSGANYTFQTNGVAQGVQWQATSDERIKKNKEKLTGIMDVLNGLTGYSYQKKTNALTEQSDFVEETGIIADDLLKVLPSAVSYLGDGFDVDGKAIEDVMAVNYSAIIPFLIEACKEQHARIEALEQKLLQTETEQTS